MSYLCRNGHLVTNNWQAGLDCSKCKANDRRRAARATANGCHAGKDGDCIHAACPQLRDGEPHATGRHCPLDKGVSDHG